MQPAWEHVVRNETGHMRKSPPCDRQTDGSFCAVWGMSVTAAWGARLSLLQLSFQRLPLLRRLPLLPLRTPLQLLDHPQAHVQLLLQRRRLRPVQPGQSHDPACRAAADSPRPPALPGAACSCAAVRWLGTRSRSGRSGRSDLERNLRRQPPPADIPRMCKVPLHDEVQARRRAAARFVAATVVWNE